MSIFGIVISTTLVLIVAGVAVLWAGSKFNGWLKAIPVIGRLF